MIQYYRKGDLFDSRADALAHGCNVRGRMNAGIAAQFRERFPDMFEDYVQRCRQGRFRLGNGYMFRNPETPHVINLATQGTYISGLEYIDSAFGWLASSYRSLGIESVAIPKIGAGLGKLEWRHVDDLVQKHFRDSDLIVEVHLR